MTEKVFVICGGSNTHTFITFKFYKHNIPISLMLKYVGMYIFIHNPSKTIHNNEIQT